MSLRINDIAPDFEADTTQGRIRFHEWIGDSWAIMFSHPKDFTPVCTTEFGAVARLSQQWATRGVKVIGLSVDPVEEHRKWAADIESFSGAKVDFPIIADPDLKIAKAYDMLPAEAYKTETPADTATVRAVYVIGPDKKIKLMMIYPMSVGRNFDEILRAVDALQLSEGVPVATPANWRPGEEVIAALSLSDDEARQKFGGFDAKLPYLRLVKLQGS
ncbi:peroxiredoxin [Oceanicella actignis]|uniref:Alkyl hydroperoxide reductase C n=1 Tax=Oceanicella actignis TaxID=1189325 RepID=A0A1M7RVV3_9RHOB|nr:peroxiredoxin [Oceanicella actignis]SET01645.1 Alkyl hydroperoxide reductase subunit AhpC (peroxiredoxin) [Oceanicella actignis]SHN50286.1 Alkyl hydroperoxide reductase subunit AhpC (peroxiredoxin) [Oceanicella actignis]